MRKFLLSCCLVSLFAAPALADLKPGAYAGVRPCRGSAKGIDVDVTSKKTIGVATCKGEIQRQLVDKGVCNGEKKGKKVEYSFQFGDDKDPQKTTGTHYVSCK